MDAIIAGLPNLHLREKIRDDDTVDQLHHFVTVYMMVFGAIIVGLKEFAGAPLDCYYETKAWKHFQDHTNTYCWYNRLYKFPNTLDHSELPFQAVDGLLGGTGNLTQDAFNSLGEINSYRWITIIFVFQALLFKLPNLLWQECNEYAGTQIEKMVSIVKDTSFESTEHKNKVYSSVAEFLERWLIINRKPFWFMKSRVGIQTKRVLQHCMLCVGANTGNYLSTAYLVVKLCFLLNVFLQFIILSAFLEFSFWEYGPKAINYYQSETRRMDSGSFPRVALCHFSVKGKGEWVQCLLSINLLLEKLFLLEWAWLLVLLVATSVSLGRWLLMILQTERSNKFIEKYLCVLNQDGCLPQEGPHTVSKFVVNYLGNDGVFLLRILAYNTNDVVISELMGQVYERFCKFKYTAKKPLTPESSADIQLEEVTMSSKGHNDGGGGGDASSNPLIKGDSHHIA